jgi:hypothetical protein
VQACEKIFRYLLYCMVSRDFDTNISKRLERELNTPDAVALWNRGSLKADATIAQFSTRPDIVSALKQNCNASALLRHADAERVYSVDFGMQCPAEKWSGGATSADIYDRVRVKMALFQKSRLERGSICDSDHSLSFYPCSPELARFLKGCMMLCHMWFHLAFDVYATFIGLLDTDLKRVCAKGSSDEAVFKNIYDLAVGAGVLDGFRLRLLAMLRL